MNNTIVWTDIPVTNLDRACGFYSAVLGAALKKESMGPGFEMVVLPHEKDNVSGCLCVMKDNKPSQNGPLVYLSVEGRLDAALQAAADKGGKVLEKKSQIGQYGFRAVIVDSEGNRVALHSRKG